MPTVFILLRKTRKTLIITHMSGMQTAWNLKKTVFRILCRIYAEAGMICLAKIRTL